MKNYELISILMKCAAGCDIRFAGLVDTSQIDPQDEDSSIVNADIVDVEEEGNIITLF